MEQPYAGRAHYEDLVTGGARITVPARKAWFTILFIGVWLCGWVLGMLFGGSMVFGDLSGSGPGLFAIVWLAGWTAGGALALRMWVWQIVGREVITLEQGVLTVAKKGALFATPKSYDLAQVRAVRVHEEEGATGPFGTRQPNLGIATTGTIRFDYGMKTVRFGDGLHEAEAKAIVRRLQEKGLLTSEHFE